MSEQKINESADAAVERIKQLTETMLAAASAAGAGVLEAHRKALQGLAEFTPQEPARAAFAGEARAQVPAAVADAAVTKQIRNLNERILARARDAGSKALDGYETALRRMSEFETKIAGASQLDWVKALAASHAKSLTDVGTLHANALRSPLANSEPAPSG